MKRLLVCVGFLLIHIPSTQAAWTNTTLRAEDRTIEINYTAQGWTGLWTETITNPTDHALEASFVMPLISGQEVADLYVDYEGQELATLPREEAREQIYRIAETSQDTTFLALADPRYTHIAFSSPLELKPQQSARITFSFTSPVYLQDDWKGLRFGFDAGSKAATQVFLSVPAHTAHVWMGGWDTEEILLSAEKTFYRWNISTPEMLTLLVSESDYPELRYHYAGMEYSGFLPRTTPISPSCVSIILDSSGSMDMTDWQTAISFVGDLLRDVFSEEQAIRIGRWSDELIWLQEDCEQNTFSTRKTLLQQLEAIRPLGKTDENILSAGLSETTWQQNDLLILITDREENFSASLPEELVPIVVGFTPQNTSLDLWARIRGGWYFPLFRSQTPTPNFDDFVRRFRAWKTLDTTREGTQENFAKALHSWKSDPWVVGRRTEKSSANADQWLGDFLPALWGERRAMGLMSQIISDDEDNQTWEDLLSVSKTFGWMEAGITPSVTLETIPEAVHTFLSDPQNWITLRYGDREQDSSFVRWQGGNLYLLEDGVWRMRNFWQEQSAPEPLRIAAFSSAYRTLFLRYGDLLARGMSVGERVDFCPAMRCISITSEGENVFSPSMEAYWKDYEPYHWANHYIGTLVHRGLWTPDLNGKLSPDRGIDRGRFVVWVAELLYPEFEEFAAEQTVFRDVPNDGSTLARAVTLLTQKGIIRGYGDGTFRPLQSLTRAEGIKILLAAQGFTGEENPTGIFADALGWEQPWVEQAAEMGIISGFVEDGIRMFHPQDTLTRAEGAKILLEGM